MLINIVCKCYLTYPFCLFIYFRICTKKRKIPPWLVNFSRCVAFIVPDMSGDIYIFFFFFQFPTFFIFQNGYFSSNRWIAIPWIFRGRPGRGYSRSRGQFPGRPRAGVCALRCRYAHWRPPQGRGDIGVATPGHQQERASHLCVSIYSTFAVFHSI